MRNLILVLLLAGAGIVTWLIVDRPEKKETVEKTTAIAVSKHSTAFNESITAVLNDYNTIAENFVKWDSASSKTAAATLIQTLESLKLEELQKDSAAIYE